MKKLGWLKGLIMWVSLCLGCGSALAGPDLYQAQVSVTGRGAAQLRVGFKHAFSAVLLKLTGQATSVQQAAAGISDNTLSSLVSRYAYTDGSATGDANSVLGLDVIFSKKMIDNYLSEKGVTVWSGDRPTVLWLWVQQTASGAPYLVLDSSVREDTQRVAHQLGLTGLFTMGDLDDQHLLSSQKQFSAKQLAAWAANYQTKAVLVAWLPMQASGTWRWQWWQTGNLHHWETEDQVNFSKNIKSGMMYVAAELTQASQLTEASGLKWWRLTVNGVAGYESFNAIFSQLKRASWVNVLQQTAIQANQVTFDLQAHGNMSVLDAKLVTLLRHAQYVSRSTLPFHFQLKPVLDAGLKVDPGNLVAVVPTNAVIKKLVVDLPQPSALQVKPVPIEDARPVASSSVRSLPPVVAAAAAQKPAVAPTTVPELTKKKAGSEDSASAITAEKHDQDAQSERDVLDTTDVDLRQVSSQPTETATTDDDEGLVDQARFVDPDVSRAQSDESRETTW